MVKAVVAAVERSGYPKVAAAAVSFEMILKDGASNRPGWAFPSGLSRGKSRMVRYRSSCVTLWRCALRFGHRQQPAALLLAFDDYKLRAAVPPVR